MLQKIKKILYYLLTIYLAVAEFFLILRFVFKFFGANGTSLFGGMVYGMAAFFKIPFYGIFQNYHIYEDAVFDTVALTAIICYILLYLLIVLIIELIFLIIKRFVNLSTPNSIQRI